ncbi:MAG: hypothetical protein Q9168_007214 [Polycauliona sp. 1 TL-2023]
MLAITSFVGALASLAAIGFASPTPVAEKAPVVITGATRHQVSRLSAPGSLVSPSGPTDSVVLKPRYDYEPGDTLARTMCYCTSDNNIEQFGDQYTFTNPPADHKMGYAYEFKYFNHRLMKSFTVTGEKICPTEADAAAGDNGTYYHNSCIDWQHQAGDYCGTFTVEHPPDGIKKDHEYVFCYHFRGDAFVLDEDWEDSFEFQTDARVMPRVRDTITGEEEVKGICEEKCQDRLGMELWTSKKGGEFSRQDSFHHFDDICDHPLMKCNSGPGHKDS